MNESLSNMKSKLSRLWDGFELKILSVNWILLTAIILVFHVNMKYKIAALLLTFLITLKRKIPFKEIPYFYYIILIISAVHSATAFLFHDDNTYFLISIINVLYWTIAITASLQMKNIVNSIQIEKIKNTITLLFILNFIFCLYNIFTINMETGVINPYTFKGLSGKYYMSTGDYIFGIFGNTSNVNAAACFLGVIYFFKKNKIMTTITLISLLLTTSNLNNIFLILILLMVLIFDKPKINKAFSICLLALIATFYARISPENFSYIKNSNQTNNETISADSSLISHKDLVMKELRNYKDSIERRQQKAVNTIAQTDTIFTTESQLSEKTISQKVNQALRALENTKADDTFLIALEEKQAEKLLKKESLDVDTEIDLDKFPGKLTSFIQTYHYAFKDGKTFLIGAGPANYSSKLAFDVSGIGEGGNLTQKFNYVSEDFAKDHLNIFLHFFSQTIDKHSIINTPFSVYNQIIGEYGFIGLLTFIFGYGLYFLKSFKKMTYGRYLLLAVTMLFATSYWFESLTIIILFELMMFLDIKEYNDEQHES